MKTSSARKKSLGLIQISPLLVIALLVAGFLAFSSKGNAGLDAPRFVLKSEDEGSSGSSGSGSSNSEPDGDDNSSSGSDSSGSSGSGSGDTEIRTEVRYPSGVRVRTREEEGRMRLDIYEGGRKLRIETKDGVTVVKVENEEEEEIEEIELDEDGGLDVEATGGARIEIRTRQNRILLKQGLVIAQTNFPVSVDQETGELTITTPQGTRVVAILPEQAVENMLASNVIDRILAALPPRTPLASPEATGEAELEGAQAIELEEENGEVVYVIEGASEERFLGLFGVLVPKTIVVSTQTGELLQIRQPLISRILDLLSF